MNKSDDTISRQDAIEAVATVTMSIHLSNVLCDKLLALPSADTVATFRTGQTYGKSTSIRELVEVVRCKDCKWYPDGQEVCQYFWDNDFCSYGERKEL